MSVESNINLYYEGLIDSIASQVGCELQQDPEADEWRLVQQAMDTRLFGMVDQAYILAHAYLEGYVTSDSSTLDWDEVWEMVMEDVRRALGGCDE